MECAGGARGRAFIHSLCVPPSVPLLLPRPPVSVPAPALPPTTSSLHSLSLSFPLLSSLTSSGPETPLPFIYRFTAHLNGRSGTWNETVNQTGSLMSRKTPWFSRSDCWAASLCWLCALWGAGHMRALPTGSHNLARSQGWPSNHAGKGTLTWLRRVVERDRAG